MTRPKPWWPALLIACLGLIGLYGGALRTRFLNDDYLFLEQARQHPLGESLWGLDALGNYWRPLSRQAYFAALAPLAGDRPLVFHAVNFVVFLGALALLADLLRAFLPAGGVLVGLLYFATLPLQRVNLTWISCGQDLLALLFALASLALFRRRRLAASAACYLAAVLSKESALPLPALLALWDYQIEKRPVRETARRMAPFALIAAAWGVAVAALWSTHPSAASALQASPTSFLAAYVHEVQSLLGLDHPPGLGRGLWESLPQPLALIAFAALALWRDPPASAEGATRPATSGERGAAPAPGSPAAREAVWFGAAWLLILGIASGPVAHTWSSYYYTLAGAGAALLVGRWLGGVRRWGWIVLASALLWWHAGSTATRAFAVVGGPWGWTSHLTSYYFERAAALTDSCARQLVRREPDPPRGTRFFFATLPPWAGFQMGNGALIRHLYRDSTLESHFYSQFSERTAGDRPCRFLYWDGRELLPLYAASRDLFFQVGGDLLLQDRLDGAAHAFRRGLASGENRLDHLYWLGWCDLWRGNRDAAESAWTSFGARDDTLAFSSHIVAAQAALLDRADTLAARRELFAAVRAAIGRPEAHAVLGELLLESQPKYGMLELKVACWLKPDDWWARRALVLGLIAARLDEPARRELVTLEKQYLGFGADSVLARARRTLMDRTPTAGMAEF